MWQCQLARFECNHSVFKDVCQVNMSYSEHVVVVVVVVDMA